MPSLPPEKVECSATSPQSLQLKWDAPPIEGRHGVIQGYKVEVVGLNSNTEEEDTKVTAERELTLHGLQKWANYSFSITPFTALGDGKSSAPILCTTDEDGQFSTSDIFLMLSRILEKNSYESASSTLGKWIDFLKLKTPHFMTWFDGHSILFFWNLSRNLRLLEFKLDFKKVYA